MVKLNISVCDFCKGIKDSGLDYRISLGLKGKKGVLLKAEICNNCYTALDTKLRAEVDFTKQIPENGSFVPSANRTPLASKEKSGCKHERLSMNVEKGVAECREEGCSYEQRI